MESTAANETSVKVVVQDQHEEVLEPLESLEVDLDNDEYADNIDGDDSVQPESFPPPTPTTPQALNDFEPTNRESDDDNNHNNNTESHTRTDHHNAKAGASETEPAGEDDRQLSAYERLRLERIRRNQQKLAQLGLEGRTSAAGGWGPRSRPKKPKLLRKKADEPAQQRSSLSRRTKTEPKNYAEPPNSVSALLRKQGEEAAAAKKDQPLEKKKTKDLSERMERFVHLEFKRIRGHKTLVHKQAKRDLRQAERELKYWKSIANKQKRREMRKAENRQSLKTKQEEERRLLGGTIKEVLQQIDARMPELVQAAAEYDDKYEAEDRRQARELKRLENEHRTNLLDSLDRFPKAIKSAVSLLNTTLLDRAPREPAPTRRSRRSTAEEIVTPLKLAQNQFTANSPEEEDTYRNVADKEAIAPEDDETSNGRDRPGTKRKRNARNVGGWVSPQFAFEIDRSWLDQDNTKAHFDLYSYVPQTGDTVLYYPAGHRAYVKDYPDILGKKTRQITRLPLWERAVIERDKIDRGEGPKTGDSSLNVWWTDEWLEGIEGDLGKYPILCRVHATNAEFPPDRFTKVIKKGEISWKDPKEQTKRTKESSRTPLRLAVTLRPLAPVVPPPKESSGDALASSTQPDLLPSRFKDDQPLALPPFFTVVTFPSQQKPFIVPFAWAYSISNSLCLDQSVVEKGREASKLHVRSFDTLSDTSYSRLDDRIEALQVFLKKCTRGPRGKLSLPTDCLESAGMLSLAETNVLLDFFDHFVKDRQSDVSDTQAVVGVFNLVRSTLPLWNGVSVVHSPDEKKDRKISPWDLSLWKKRMMIPDYSPDNLSDASLSMDDRLRDRIERVIDDIAKNDSNAEFFRSPVTEEDAPSYPCAVPLSISLDKIIRRLKGGKSGSQRCYYRNTDSLLSDVSSLLENCLLYNSPESSLVETAVALVSKIKDEISRVAKDHFKEVIQAKKADEERKSRILRHCEAVDTAENCGITDSLKELYVMSSIRKPYKDQIDLEWLQQTTEIVENRDTGVSTPHRSWVPQAGDDILYCPSLHSEFVKAHFSSLEPYQCIVHNLQDYNLKNKNEAADDSTALTKEGFSDKFLEGWVKGRVIWVRSSFPKYSTKKDGVEAKTFPSNSSILVAGIKLEPDFDDTKPRIICWRPCIFDYSVCKICGLSTQSFFKPCDGNDEAFEESKLSLSLIELQTIDRCFNFLKKRCIQGTEPSYIDHQLTRANVRQGYLPPSGRSSAKSLPAFELAYKDAQKAKVKGTRGAKVSVCPGIPEALIRHLLDFGFLAPFVLSSGKSNKEKLHNDGMISPWPKMSLELIHSRVKNGFYRHRAAILNDVIEAYSSVVFLVLAEAGKRKRSLLSIRRIARALAASKSHSNGEEETVMVDTKTIDQEEIDLLKRIRKIRELYATALVVVSDTIHSERIFGLVDRPSLKHIPKSTEPVLVQSPEQIQARKRLEYILLALSRDQLQNTFPSIESNGTTFPTIKVKLSFGGKLLMTKMRVSVDKFAVGFLGTKEVNLKIRLNGRQFTMERAAPQLLTGSSALNDLSTNDTNTRDSTKVAKGREFKHVLCDSVCFDHEDYEGKDSLVKLFFGKPGRLHPCARCQAYRRSLLSCRVRRSHSNVDFDWVENFSTTGGLEKLLKQMNPEWPEWEVCEVGKSATDNTLASEKPLPSPLEEIEKEDGNDNDDGDADEDGDPDVEDGTQEVDEEEEEDELALELADPQQMIEKAEKTLCLAKSVQQEADVYYKAPVRLSKAFVETAFPIDPTDGHCVYCIVCGLSGDLLCCDGCANVVHGKCIGLTSFPEGDWFCEECLHKKLIQNGLVTNRRRGSSDAAPIKGNGDLRLAEENGHCPKTAVKFDAFGRFEFDDEHAEKVSTLLDELRAGRPEQPRKRKPAPGQSLGSNKIAGIQRRAEFLQQPIVLGGELSGLVPMARKFLGAVGIETADAFLSMRTTDLAKRFATWRRKTGMAKLNGSGETAYVSSWKSACRKLCGDIEHKMVYLSDPGDDDDDGSYSKRKVRRRKKGKTRPNTTGNRRRRLDLQSLTDPLEALSTVNQQFLATIDISTAKEFLTTRTGDIADALVKWRIKEGLPRLKGNGEVATISAAKTSCRKIAREMGWTKVADIESAGRAVFQRKEIREESNPRKRKLSTPQVATRRQASKASDDVESEVETENEADAPSQGEKNGLSKEKPLAKRRKRNTVEPVVNKTVNKSRRSSLAKAQVRVTCLQSKPLARDARAKLHTNTKVPPPTPVARRPGMRTSRTPDRFGVVAAPPQKRRRKVSPKDAEEPSEVFDLEFSAATNVQSLLLKQVPGRRRRSRSRKK
jgi:hypothetical protein